MADPNLMVMKILGSIFLISLFLGLVTAGNKLAYKILFPIMVSSGICLLVAELWLLFP